MRPGSNNVHYHAIRTCSWKSLSCSQNSSFLPSQDNLDSVEALIKKHEDFEKSLDAQEEKMNAIDSVSKKLMAADHYASLAIANRRDAVLQR